MIQKTLVVVCAVLLALELSNKNHVEAFWSLSFPIANKAIQRPLFSTATTTSTTLTEEETTAIYDQLGIQPENLALGIQPEDVLKYVGTRETLIAKTKADIPSFNMEKVVSEVDKFLMDAEMLDLYIRYQKEVEKDPNFKVPDPPQEDGGLFSARNIALAYVSFLTITKGPDVLRGYIADQQVAGTYQPIGIPFFDAWVDKTSTEAIAEALTRAASDASATETSTLVP